MSIQLSVYLNIILRTLFMYALITVIFRIMGKREIGELSILDLVVFIMIGEMAVLAIEKHYLSIWDSILPMLLLMAIQVGLAFLSLKVSRFRKLMDGHPSIIIFQGKINEKEMRRQRYNFDDLMMQLREKEVWNLNEVEYALLEPNGKLSVLKKENAAKKPERAVPLIIDGEIQREGLKELGKTEDWLLAVLKKTDIAEPGDVLFCSYSGGNLHIHEKERKRKSRPGANA